MIIIVDTNIVFSAILNIKSTIGDLILNSNNIFEFRSCNYLIREIDNHWKKLQQISKLSHEELIDIQRIVFKNIRFINEELIPKEFWIKSYNLVNKIDMDDIAFIALNEFHDSLFWTGDKVLINGLRSLGYKKIFSTDELITLRNSLESKSSI